MVNCLPEETLLPEPKARATMFPRGDDSPCLPQYQSPFILLYRVPHVYVCMFTKDTQIPCLSLICAIEETRPSKSNIFMMESSNYVGKIYNKIFKLRKNLLLNQ